MRTGAPRRENQNEDGEESVPVGFLFSRPMASDADEHRAYSRLFNESSFRASSDTSRTPTPIFRTAPRGVPLQQQVLLLCAYKARRLPRPDSPSWPLVRGPKSAR